MNFPSSIGRSGVPGAIPSGTWPEKVDRTAARAALRFSARALSEDG